MRAVYRILTFRRAIQYFLILSLVLYWVLFSTAMAQMSEGSGGDSGGRTRKGGKGEKNSERPTSAYVSPGTGFITRHEFVLLYGVDAKYAGKTNRLSQTEQNQKEGGRLFGIHCSKCHNTKNSAQSEKIIYMSPKPPQLDQAVQLPLDTDTYLFWTISTGGGARFNTAMPRFADNGRGPRPDDALNNRKIWQIAMYLEALQAQSGKRVLPVVARQKRQPSGTHPGKNMPGRGGPAPDDLMNRELSEER